MDDYQEDPPNPFSTSPTSRSTTTLDNPTDRPSWGTSSDHRDRTDQNEDGSKPLPPKPPLFGRSDSEADVAGGGAGGGPRTQAGMIAGYPELDLYPSGRTSSTRLFDDHDDDDEEGHGSVPHATAAGSKPTPMYPDLDLYPATTPAPTDDQTQRPSIYAASNTSWSNNAPTSPPSGRSQPPIQRSPSQPHQQTQGQPQPQGQTQRSPPPTHRPSFPSPGMGSKSYIGPKVKEEACCELDEVLTGAGGGAGGAGEGGSGNGGVVVEVSLSGLGLVWFDLKDRLGSGVVPWKIKTSDGLMVPEAGRLLVRKGVREISFPEMAGPDGSLERKTWPGCHAWVRRKPCTHDLGRGVTPGLHG